MQSSFPGKGGLFFSDGQSQGSTFDRPNAQESDALSTSL
jgi:hypothetical protein